jgi:hypothetical protein
MKFVLYTSTLNHAHYDAFVVPDIIKTARAENSENAITGVLLFDGKNFTQYIEGQEADVDRLMDNILNDRRHHNIVVVLSGHHQERLYKDWAMGLFYISDQTHDTESITSHADFNIENFKKMVERFDVE